MSDIILTIDVEDWFQVENFKPWISYSTWSSRELRVEKKTNQLLDLLDSLKNVHPTNNLPKATFFILGWIAERIPDLVKEIHNRGHEVASHGYFHKRCDRQPLPELKADLQACKKILEDIISAKVYGYRAPNFSINNKVLQVIEECGYKYDSSYNSFGLHGRYGHLALPHSNNKSIAVNITKDFYEIPVSNLKIGKTIIPLGGGGYFRLMPFMLFKYGVKKILQKDNAYIFYMHPWEIDPEQPRVDEASPAYKFRHYINLDKTAARLSALIKSFKHCSFVTCSEYINFIRE
ncbi:hypothetical protein BuS5_00013 [Desulfosarcina sp. BuS5]|uniref:XrtA system polysaccharide deacetylase n=1 Tax=Desulfosarcina sp. BuS5 TaxID=933262 RepID=UPI00048872B1|nr:XrtA system polysaccharide deacetylase [Desulfosarcina sp. BuS5]WDN87045.1 hypothetical protein BuS5_00013 [Desulfosarcina sp. BuS5]